jgi:hypothetical protein
VGKVFREALMAIRDEILAGARRRCQRRRGTMVSVWCVTADVNAAAPVTPGRVAIEMARPL